jgi:hypothetical protein
MERERASNYLALIILNSTKTAGADLNRRGHGRCKVEKSPQGVEAELYHQPRDHVKFFLKNV